MATSEIDGAHVIPRYIHTFADELHQVIHEVGGRIIGNFIKSAPAQRYSRRLIIFVNRNEEESEGQKQRTITVLIKVLGLSHKRGKQSDPRIVWFMFHYIYFRYSDINNKE